MVLRLIFVGNASELYRELEGYYLTRLKAVLKTEIFEVPKSKATSPERRLREEAARIKKLLKGGIYVMDASGMLVNDSFMLQLVKSSIYDDVSVVVGGPHGVAPEVEGERISFSRLIFPHDLFRIMLLEQLYRQALTLKGVKYKK
ncbi:MAG: 23S rRNA pseudoU1915 N3-methylase RlmH [Candidatus Alkanophagales archaeon MCA70_species_2]|nr:23S rRNA pseudoU1915 N3-methylase RlmH [Candidatus Alkanophaga liquidiphilum]